MTTSTREIKHKIDLENIFFQENLVISDDGDYIIMVTKDNKDYSFGGVTIWLHPDCMQGGFGEYCGSWSKDCYKQFHGTIHLKSDGER